MLFDHKGRSLLRGRDCEEVSRRAGWLCAALALGIAVVLRLRIDSIGIADPDTWGYIYPAFSWLSGHGLQQTNGRAWLYPAFVVLCLKAFGSMRGLIMVQQVLGVLSGCLFWLTLGVWKSLMPSVWAREVAIAVLGPIGIAVYLFNPQTLLIELQLRPESIVGFGGFMQILFATVYIQARWKTHEAQKAFFAGVFAILAYINFLLKPSWGLAIGCAILPVFVGIFGSNFARWSRWGTPITSAILVFLVLWLPAKTYDFRDRESKTFLPVTLFAIHAKWILQQMEGYCETERQEPVRRGNFEGFSFEVSHGIYSCSSVSWPIHTSGIQRGLSDV